MRVLHVFLSVVLSVEANNVGWSEFRCPDSHYLSKIESAYGGHGNRLYQFACTRFPQHVANEQCVYTPLAEALQGDMLLACGDDEYASGVSIMKTGLGEQWKMMCCRADEVVVETRDCEQTRLINEHKQFFAYMLDPGFVARKLQSMYSEKDGDRRWFFEMCPVTIGNQRIAELPVQFDSNFKIDDSKHRQMERDRQFHHLLQRVDASQPHLLFYQQLDQSSAPGSDELQNVALPYISAFTGAGEGEIRQLEKWAQDFTSGEKSRINVRPVQRVTQVVPTSTRRPRTSSTRSAKKSIRFPLATAPKAAPTIRFPSDVPPSPPPGRPSQPSKLPPRPGGAASLPPRPGARRSKPQGGGDAGGGVFAGGLLSDDIKFALTDDQGRFSLKNGIATAIEYLGLCSAKRR